MPIVSGGGTDVVVDDLVPFLAEPEPSHLGIRNLWTGWDGSSWDLDEPLGGVVLAQASVRGYQMPVPIPYRSASPVVAGSLWRGNNIDNRSVMWPIYVYVAATVSDQDWISLDRAFWTTIRPDKQGTWTVVQPTGERRSLDLRFESLDDDGTDHDPSAGGWALYGIGMLAEQPFWYGDPVVREFRQVTAAQFFSPPGSGSVVNIAPGSSLSNATMQNPGDVSRRVDWTLGGPFTSAQVGVAGVTIDVPFAMTLGQSLTIYTAPDLLIAIDQDGIDRTRELGPLSNLEADVEPGMSVPLSLSLISPTSDSYVQASLVPHYYRAW